MFIYFSTSDRDILNVLVDECILSFGNVIQIVYSFAMQSRHFVVSFQVKMKCKHTFPASVLVRYELALYPSCCCTVRYSETSAVYCADTSPVFSIRKLI